MWQYILQNPYEVGGFATSLICVWLAARGKVWSWFWAIISSLLSAKLFFDLRLYGDMCLQFVFIAGAFYGFYAWLYGGRQASNLPISYVSWRVWLVLMPFTCMIFGAMCFVLWRLRGDLVLLDAFTTTLSLLGQYLTMRKHIENWLVWIIANILYVYLYIAKGAPLYAVLYALFIVLAFYGWWNWRRLYEAQKTSFEEV